MRLVSLHASMPIFFDRKTPGKVPEKKQNARHISPPHSNYNEHMKKKKVLCEEPPLWLGGVLFIVTVKCGGGQVALLLSLWMRDPTLDEFPDVRGSDVWRVGAYLRVRQLNRPCKPKPTYCARRRA